MKLIKLLLYFAAALIADFFKVVLAYVIHDLTLTISPQAKRYVQVAQMVPWDALIFGLTFGFIAFIFNRNKQDSGITKDDYLAFVFICPLIQVIAQYLLAITGKAFSSFYINPFYFFAFTSALFIALVAEKGLYLKLKLLGVVVVATLGALVFFLAPYISKNFHFDISFYWYSVIGVAMAIFALLNEESEEQDIDRDNLATINKLRRLY